jgi:hypothetical protein
LNWKIHLSLSSSWRPSVKEYALPQNSRKPYTRPAPKGVPAWHKPLDTFCHTLTSLRWEVGAGYYSSTALFPAEISNSLSLLLDSYPNETLFRIRKTEWKIEIEFYEPLFSKWYLNFLKDRRQRIVSQGTTCKWKDINKGVMQGTVTGPHFFNLFINDLEIKNCSNTPLVKFADDSSLLLPILKNTQDCSSKAIDELKDGSESNSLPLNEGKCK